MNEPFVLGPFRVGCALPARPGMLDPQAAPPGPFPSYLHPAGAAARRARRGALELTASRSGGPGSPGWGKRSGLGARAGARPRMGPITQRDEIWCLSHPMVSLSPPEATPSVGE